MNKFFNIESEFWVDKEIESLNFSKSCAILYPNEYKVASANLGFHSIFKNISKFGVKPVRFFFDKYTSSFFTLDSDKKLNQFENIFVSISFENDLDNLLTGFNNSFGKVKNIFNRIIIGGAAATLSPFLFKDIASEIAIGDCEQFFYNLNDINELNFLNSSEIKKFFDSNCSQDLLLNQNESYKSKLNSQILKFRLKYNNCSDVNFPVYSSFVSKYSSFKNYFLIEISRGCPFNCKFCTLRNLRQKIKLFDIEKIIKHLYSGYLITKNFGLISAFMPPIKYIREIKSRFSDAILHFSSLRVDSIDENFLNIISDLKLQTITIAPETADENIRKFIGKNFSNKEIIDFILNAIKIGISKIKLYFIIGLKSMEPGYEYFQRENLIIDEAKQIVDLVELIMSKIYEKIKKKPFISISINPLIPKPATDLWNYRFIDSNLYKKVKEYIRKELYKKNSIKNNVELELLSYNEAKKEYCYSWNCKS